MTRARHDGDAWVLDTPQGPVRARHLVAASGGHNTPLIPPVQRIDSRVREWHASALHAPQRWPAATCWWWVAAPRPST